MPVTAAIRWLQPWLFMKSHFKSRLLGVVPSPPRWSEPTLLDGTWCGEGVGSPGPVLRHPTHSDSPPQSQRCLAGMTHVDTCGVLCCRQLFCGHSFSTEAAEPPRVVPSGNKDLLQGSCCSPHTLALEVLPPLLLHVWQFMQLMACDRAFLLSTEAWLTPSSWGQ